jgi:DNA-binding response OmpR family regulator
MRKLPLLWILEDDFDMTLVYEDLFRDRYDLRFFKELAELRASLEGRERHPALLIADLQLSDGCFMALACQGGIHLEFPYVVVSGSDQLTRLEQAFAHGARDYFVKPINRNAMLFKIERLLSESTLDGPATRPSFAGLTLDAFAQNVTRENRPIEVPLTQTEFRMMALFFRAPFRRLHRDHIISTLWAGEQLSHKVFDFHLSKAREKLARLSVAIDYRSGEGYRLVPA